VLEPLSSKQKKYLKSQANSLKPLVQIGKAGVNQSVIQSIDTALGQHELIKVKFIAFKEEKEQFLASIVKDANAQFVSLIGHILTLYREHEEQEQRQYKLPM
jgi:RNA-binding protein